MLITGEYSCVNSHCALLVIPTVEEKVPSHECMRNRSTLTRNFKYSTLFTYRFFTPFND